MTPTFHRRTTWRLAGVSLAVVVLSGFVPHTVAGQTNERLYEELDFRFLTPGARAAAMGYAFVGLADDATAAYTNPAGLSNLLKPEVSFEMTVTGINHQRLVTTDPAPTFEDFGDVVVSPSFFSFALPLPGTFGNRFTLSLFTNRVQDYRETFAILRRQGPLVPGFDQSAFGTTSVQVNNYAMGLSAIGTSWLSVGGSLVLATADVASKIRNGQGINVRNGTDTIDSGVDVTGVFGILLKPFRQISVGATYHGKSSFDLVTTLFGEFLQNGQDVPMTGDTLPVEYVVPDKFSFGTAVRPVKQPLVVLLDASYVRYSQQISDKFLVVDFMDPAAGITRDNFVIPDVWEFHAGAEYLFFLKNAAIGIRAGGFTDPDHQMRFEPNDPQTFADNILGNRFNGPDNDGNEIGDLRDSQPTHFGGTFGAGIALYNRVQLDAAASYTRDQWAFVASIVIRIS